MYDLFLILHNIVRWIALILAVLAVARALWGWLGSRNWTETDRKVGSFFAISMDVQLLLGLILYVFLSPITRAALQDFGQAMSVPDLRFFALEHLFYMLLAVIFAHVGNVTSRRAEGSTAKFRRAAIWFGLALILMLLGMPWMRPLLRL